MWEGMELLSQPFGPRTKLNHSSSSFDSTWERNFFKHKVVIRMKILTGREKQRVSGIGERAERLDLNSDEAFGFRVRRCRQSASSMADDGRLSGVVECEGHNAAPANVGGQGWPEAHQARAVGAPNSWVDDSCRSGRQQCPCRIL